MRADRINEEVQKHEGTKGKKSLASENLLLITLTDTDAIVAQIESLKPDLVIIDSIQTIESQNVSGLSGSVGQVRYGALQFVRVAKQHNIPIMIVGHVTKEGMVAGPMVLSHMVDTVLFLEGEKFTKTRILRGLKNRFGPVDEVGIFLMEEAGMQEATNPEQLFLDSGRENVPGSVLVTTLEGSRAFLVELQALAVFSKLPMPRRVVSGVDPRRVELLLAVLQKHCRLPVETMDVFVNVAGGLKLSDPAIDLGICLAVFSSVKNIPLTATVGMAEVGLLGELRMVNGLEKRIREAQKLGFKHIITAKTHKLLGDVIREFGREK
jgi:DNA repair protein RadA/Sms